MTTRGEQNGPPTTHGPAGRSRLADLAGPPAPIPAPGRPPAGASPAEAPTSSLDAFRRTPVLVPTTPEGGLWTADHGGVRWICAFSDEDALARFAEARGEAPRTWRYRTLLGADLLDALAPRLGVPAGVSLDPGSGHATAFPLPADAPPAGGEPGARADRQTDHRSRP
ncbi:SseB family protein [Streptomyces sp. CC228A]|uniref:SseB family protein n=1 Tax=Streptomyces sp. CC228A TaxID=2898186 RepID=UPI001F16F4C6|nr:SseB family protein [Streptomyces sp. CC228A]